MAVERVQQYVNRIQPEQVCQSLMVLPFTTPYTIHQHSLLQVEGTITSPYHWPSEGIVTLKNVKLRFPIKRWIS